MQYLIDSGLSREVFILVDLWVLAVSFDSSLWGLECGWCLVPTCLKLLSPAERQLEAFIGWNFQCRQCWCLPQGHGEKAKREILP